MGLFGCFSFVVVLDADGFFSVLVVCLGFLNNSHINYQDIILSVVKQKLRVFSTAF